MIILIGVDWVWFCKVFLIFGKGLDIIGDVVLIEVLLLIFLV